MLSEGQAWDLIGLCFDVELLAISWVFARFASASPSTRKQDCSGDVTQIKWMERV